MDVAELILAIFARIQREESAMTTMMHWSPFTPKFHLHHHHVEDLFPRFFDGTTDEAAPPAASWLPAAEGRLEDGTYIIQFALPGVDPKAVDVSLMDNVLTVKGERKANHDSTGKDYFVREVAYGAFQRSVTLPEGVDAAQVEAKYANGMLEVRVPGPRAATPRMIEVKAA
jgi:HSP20 family protein